MTVAEDLQAVRLALAAVDSDIWGNPSGLQAPAQKAFDRLVRRIRELEAIEEKYDRILRMYEDRLVQ